MPSAREQRRTRKTGERPVRGTFRKITHTIGRTVDALLGALGGGVGGAIMGAGSGISAGIQVGMTGLAENPLTIHMDKDRETGFTIIGDRAHAAYFPNEEYGQNFYKPEGQNRNPVVPPTPTNNNFYLDPKIKPGDV